MYREEQVRKDFPILQRRIHGKPLCYLDSAATSQKPKKVIDAVTFFYTNTNANVHRGVYVLSEEATTQFEEAHANVQKFVHAGDGEIIFTSGTTHSLNLLAYTLGSQLRKGDEIVLTQMEHHSNLVPWQQIAKQKNAILKFIPITKEGKLDMRAAASLINKKTAIVATTHVSNALGTIVEVKELAKLAHTNGAKIVVDAAQSVPHMPIDVKALDADFLAFSGHKMCAPTGTGVLYGKKELLEELPPFFFGGDMIKEVQWQHSSWNTLPWKFEAGTPNISGAIGLSAAVDYLQELGMENIAQHEQQLTEYAMAQLSGVEGVKIYGPKERGGIISFNVGKIHAHDVASILDREGIAVRGGHHCTMPLHNALGIAGSVRMSFAPFTTKAEIDQLIQGLEKVKKVFSH